MTSAALFLHVQGGLAWLLWVQPLTDCTSSLSNMFRVIVLNSSCILLTVFCHLLRQPSCQAAFPHGYCSDPFQHFDVKMPRILSSENVLTLLLFFDTFHNEFFSIPKWSLRNWLQPFFLDLSWQQLEGYVKLHFICDK